MNNTIDSTQADRDALINEIRMLDKKFANSKAKYIIQYKQNIEKILEDTVGSLEESDASEDIVSDIVSVVSDFAESVSEDLNEYESDWKERIDKQQKEKDDAEQVILTKTIANMTKTIQRKTSNSIREYRKIHDNDIRTLNAQINNYRKKQSKTVEDHYHNEIANKKKYEIFISRNNQTSNARANDHIEHIKMYKKLTESSVKNANLSDEKKSQFAAFCTGKIALHNRQRTLILNGLKAYNNSQKPRINKYNLKIAEYAAEMAASSDNVVPEEEIIDEIVIEPIETPKQKDIATIDNIMNDVDVKIAKITSDDIIQMNGLKKSGKENLEQLTKDGVKITDPVKKLQHNNAVLNEEKAQKMRLHSLKITTMQRKVSVYFSVIGPFRKNQYKNAQTYSNQTKNKILGIKRPIDDVLNDNRKNKTYEKSLNAEYSELIALNDLQIQNIIKERENKKNEDSKKKDKETAEFDKIMEKAADENDKINSAYNNKISQIRNTMRSQNGIFNEKIKNEPSELRQLYKKLQQANFNRDEHKKMTEVIATTDEDMNNAEKSFIAQITNNKVLSGSKKSTLQEKIKGVMKKRHDKFKPDKNNNVANMRTMTKNASDALNIFNTKQTTVDSGLTTKILNQRRDILEKIDENSNKKLNEINSEYDDEKNRLSNTLKNLKDNSKISQTNEELLRALINVEDEREVISQEAIVEKIESIKSMLDDVNKHDEVSDNKKKTLVTDLKNKISTLNGSLKNSESQSKDRRKMNAAKLSELVNKRGESSKIMVQKIINENNERIKNAQTVLSGKVNELTHEYNASRNSYIVKLKGLSSSEEDEEDVEAALNELDNNFNKHKVEIVKLFKNTVNLSNNAAIKKLMTVGGNNAKKAASAINPTNM